MCSQFPNLTVAQLCKHLCYLVSWNVSALLVLIFIFYMTSFVSNMSTHEEDYTLLRQQLLQEELAAFSGGKLNLTQKEIQANRLITAAKSGELYPSYKNESLFLPLRSFLHARQDIENTAIYKLIREIPKGASLHTHMLAAVNVDFIVQNITYRDDIYGGFVNGVFKIRFFRDGHQDGRCEWKLLSEMRRYDPNFDKWLRELFLVREEDRTSTEKVWAAFKKIFNTGYEMYSCRDVFEDVLYQILLELHLDNVMYTELRGTILPLYDVDGTVYTPRQYFHIFQQVVQKFKRDHPDFFGARYIHSVYRGVSDDVLEEEVAQITDLRRTFPDLIAGLDLIGYEEEGHSLFHYHDILRGASRHMDLFLHAGETNWFGHTDRNLADAVLLNSRRLGHAYALPKHPELLRKARERDMAVELCPLSNQVLLLQRDPRAHPAVLLMASSFPVVVCNDDPSVWGASGLSHDWYVAFVAMTPKRAGLEVLKTFAMDSIRYSTVSAREKEVMMTAWRGKWEQFLESVVQREERVLGDT